MDAFSPDRPWSEHIGLRFGVTLLTNFLKAGCSLASGVLIARGMGASQYGDLTFLLGSFVAISQLLELGTSSAFYTFISRRPRGRAVFFFYLGWLIVQFLATVLVVGLLLPGKAVEWIWVGQPREIILLAFCASFMMTQTWGLLSHLGEAQRKTVVIQAATVSQAVLHLALIAIAIHWHWLTVNAVLYLLVGEYLLLALTLGPWLVLQNLAYDHQSGDDLGMVAREFAAYCKPLIVCTWVGFLYAFADTWLLQHFGGAEQQGFYAVGQQFANVSIIVTVSILKVFWKEIAEARERGNNEPIRRLYRSVSQGLYFVGAWISCLLIPYSRDILAWTAGAAYEAGWLCLAIMLLYPIHQSLGQVQGTLFYASGETASYARITFLMMGFGIPMTYLMLAPNPLGGLDLGAVGLAIKMVIVQLVGVNIQEAILARTNGWTSHYGYQWLLLGPLLTLGFASKWSAEWVFHSIHPSSGNWPVMVLGGTLYAGLSLVLVYRVRKLAVFSYNDVIWAMGGVMRRMRTVVS